MLPPDDTHREPPAGSGPDNGNNAPPRDAPHPDPDQIAESLDRIEQAGALGRGRLPTLLRYLVGEEMAGRGERLKGYAIAVDVLRRGEDFDPSIDSHVRVEMMRLRKALEEYYASAENSAPLTIYFDKGSYRPRFRTSRQPAAPRPRLAQWAKRRLAGAQAKWAFAGIALLLAIGSMLAADLFPNRTSGNCSRPYLTLRLLDFPGREIVPLQGSFNAFLQAYPLVRNGREGDACTSMRHRLELKPASSPGAGQDIRASLYRDGETTPYWSQIIAHENAAAAPDLLIARALYLVASPEGVLPQKALQLPWRSDEAKRDYACRISAHYYFINRLTDDPADELQCLETAMKEPGAYADIFSHYAMIVQIQLLERSGRKPRDPGALRARYNETLAQAFAIDPADCGALTARMREYRRSLPPDLDRLAATIRSAKRHCAGNANMLNQAAMAEGYYFGNWPESAALIENAVAISGSQPQYQYAELGNLIVDGRWADAHRRLQKSQSLINPLDGLWLIMVGRRAGDDHMIEEGRRFLKTRSMDSHESAANYLRGLGYHRSILAIMLGELDAYARTSGWT
ncbi:hypothetical protein [Sphingopyxis sp.]|jgi:hypothetical protein|uniref:hypothetical protein n=1 Tax=Sphingopyxis sp. TaxID=1908224 RepID=UPI002DE204FA|nr:hypothetical protein [Sphingopyxis sp.]